MRMAADDMVHATAEQPVCQVFVGLRGVQRVFDAPVGKCDNQVGRHPFRFLDVTGYLHRVDIVYDIRLLHPKAVRGIGEVQQRNAESVLLYKQRVVLFAFGCVFIGAQVGNFQRVHHHDGALQSFLVRVQAVVVSGGQYVEAGVHDVSQIFVRSGKTRIPFIGRPAQRHLEIGDSQVRSADFRFHQSEALLIVIAVSASCRIDLRAVLHQVASNQYRQAVGFRFFSFLSRRVVASLAFTPFLLGARQARTNQQCTQR